MKNFECEKCGSCCRQPGFVYLEEGEAERLAEALEMGLYDFTDKYCEVLERRHLALRKLEDETCIFLGQEGCRVYGARPRQCLDFPQGWHTPNSEKYCGSLKRNRLFV